MIGDMRLALAAAVTMNECGASRRWWVSRLECRSEVAAGGKECSSESLGWAAFGREETSVWERGQGCVWCLEPTGARTVGVVGALISREMRVELFHGAWGSVRRKPSRTYHGEEFETRSSSLSAASIPDSHDTL